MKNRKLHSFSLVELLVVVAVILILGAILIPVILPMKERARRVECASNLKQLWLASNSYAIDNSGAFPKSYSYRIWVPTNNAWSVYDEGWVAWNKNIQLVDAAQNLVSYTNITSGTTSLTSITTGTLYPYLGRTKIYACPTMKAMLARGTNVIRSYAMNSVMSGANYSGLQFPSRTMLYTEMGIYKDAHREFGKRVPDGNSESEYALEDGMTTWQDSDPVKGGYRIFDRVHDGEFAGWTNSSGLLKEHMGAYHDGKANCVFGDGHIEMIAFTNTYTLCSGNWIKID